MLYILHDHRSTDFILAPWLSIIKILASHDDLRLLESVVVLLILRISARCEAQNILEGTLNRYVM